MSGYKSGGRKVMSTFSDLIIGEKINKYLVIVQDKIK